MLSQHHVVMCGHTCDAHTSHDTVNLKSYVISKNYLLSKNITGIVTQDVILVLQE